MFLSAVAWFFGTRRLERWVGDFSRSAAGQATAALHLLIVGRLGCSAWLGHA